MQAPMISKLRLKLQARLVLFTVHEILLRNRHAWFLNGIIGFDNLTSFDLVDSILSIGHLCRIFNRLICLHNCQLE